MQLLVLSQVKKGRQNTHPLWKDAWAQAFVS